MSQAVYTMEGIGKRFGYRAALEDVSFEIAEGEFLLLLGNNGAGKTTLLKILSTLMRPSSGRLTFRGQPFPAAAFSARRDLGMISHDSHSYPDLTALENLRVFGTLYRVPDLRRRCAEVLEAARLEDVPDVPVRAFSSGMLKRLSIAKVMLYRPRVLLLDEPYSGLDMSSVELLDSFLERFQAEGGTTVMVTHQFTSGIGMATRIAVLLRGRLVYNQEEQQVTAGHCAELLHRFGGQGTPTEPS
ncbi:MAG: heme ABC exporter ATP-binding protein CcmA [bacterium]